MKILQEHDPQWAHEFQRLKAVYQRALGEVMHSIEHVGSTAIKEIAAKPILDIDIVISDLSYFPEATRRLESLGYRHNGDQGIPGREAFKRVDERVPHDGASASWMNHHLYVCAVDSTELMRHVLFRDFLNAHQEARQAYEQIKKDIAARSGGDRKVYADIKENEEICSNFVENILIKAQ